MKKALLVLFSLVFGLEGGCRTKRSYRLPLLESHTSKLEHTRFAATPHESVDPNANLIYCPTFQLAWNQLYRMLGGPVRTEPSPKTVEHLNRRGFTKKDIDKAAVTVEVTPDKAKKQIRIFTTLKKNLKFRTPFNRLTETIHFRHKKKETEILGFGLEMKDRATRTRQSGQVNIIDSTDTTSFIVSLEAKNTDDLMVLARIRPRETLGATYRAVDETVRRNLPSAEKPRPEDQLIVPFFNFKLDHDYRVLLKTVIQNQAFKGWFIDRAHQMIRLRLDEKGALLYSESSLDITCSAPVRGRTFAFTAPFLFYMRKRSSQAPYLLMWVGHPEILVRP